MRRATEAGTLYLHMLVRPRESRMTPGSSMISSRIDSRLRRHLFSEVGDRVVLLKCRIGQQNRSLSGAGMHGAYHALLVAWWPRHLLELQNLYGGRCRV
jgi:hypothetical protein